MGERRAPRVLPLKREHVDLWGKGSPETRRAWRRPDHPGSRGIPGQWRQSQTGPPTPRAATATAARGTQGPSAGAERGQEALTRKRWAVANLPQRPKRGPKPKNFEESEKIDFMSIATDLQVCFISLDLYQNVIF